MKSTPQELTAAFVKYEAVRRSGHYNMLTESGAARDEAGLTHEQYCYVMDNYSYLKSL